MAPSIAGGGLGFGGLGGFGLGGGAMYWVGPSTAPPGADRALPRAADEAVAFDCRSTYVIVNVTDTVGAVHDVTSTVQAIEGSSMA